MFRGVDPSTAEAHFRTVGAWLTVDSPPLLASRESI